MAADVVRLAGNTLLVHEHESASVIVDIKPVADVRAGAVYRERLLPETIQNRERDKLLREMIRPVIVRAVRNQNRQSVRIAPGADEMIGRRLRCAIRRMGRIRR